MERFLTEYLVNSIWQVPLIAAAAWLLVRSVRPSPQVQHWIWVNTLPLMLAMPLLWQHSGIAPQALPAPLPAVSASPGDISADFLAAPVDTSPQISEPQSDLPLAASQAQPASTAANESTSWLPLREIQLSASATHLLVGLYLSTIAFMMLRLFCGWWIAHRLAAHAQPAVLNAPDSDLLNRCCHQFEVRRPRVLVSSKTTSPMVVGILRPSLLLPEGFSPQSERELEAVWLHELAHVRRRDYFANLAYRIVSLPVAYHPATYAVHRRIRQTREMVCDAMAAAGMQSSLGYARCLVDLARSMQNGRGLTPQFEAAGMFDGGVLEERVMQLIETKSVVNLHTQVIRLAGGIAMGTAVLAAATMLHVTPTMAQTATPASPDATQGVSHPDPTPITVESQPATGDAPIQSPASAKKQIAAGKVTEPKVETKRAESRKQMDDARKELDNAANAWSDLAEKTASDAAHDKASDAANAEANRQMEDARRRLHDATRAWNEAVAKAVDESVRAKMNSAEMQEKLAKARAKFDNPEFQKKMADIQARVNSPEFKKKIADAQAKFDSPEFKKQMEEAQAKANNPEFQKKVAEIQARINSPEFQKKIADAQAKFNTPEFKKKMEEMNQRMAEVQKKFDSPEFRKKMEELNSPEFKQKMKDAKKKYDNPEFRKEMELLNQEFSKSMEEVRRQINDAVKDAHAPAVTIAPPQ